MEECKEERNKRRQRNETKGEVKKWESMKHEERER